MDGLVVEASQHLVDVAEGAEVILGDLGHVPREPVPEALACDLELDRLDVLALDLDALATAGVDAEPEQVGYELLRDAGRIRAARRVRGVDDRGDRGVGAEALEPEAGA